jgi:hypothetical protein
VGDNLVEAKKFQNRQVDTAISFADGDDRSWLVI